MISVFSLVVLAFVVAGVATASATRSAIVVRVPVVAYRLHATLAPVGSATGSGRFDALLVRTGPGQAPATASPRVPAPGVVCPANPRMGVPCRIGPGAQFPPFAIPPSGVRWTLVWRLGLTNVTGPASASIHVGMQGTASPAVGALCSNCQLLTRGHMTVSTDQALGLLKSNGYVDVQATSGELSGHIVTINHFSTVALVRH
jgi:hypothetical protein